jgi:mannose-6-phosphate isomerase-like protein (cupin superfamily)
MSDFGTNLAPVAIFDRDLVPSWDLKRAREPGFRRSLTTWVGGPEGYINSNLGVSALSRGCAVGLMRMAVGERQPGVHVHSVTEIYVILRGEVESFDGVGRTHRAGRLDCLYIPKAVPHGVRAVGDEDLELIWVHDGIERNGVSVYLEGDGPFAAEREVELIRFQDLRPAGEARGGSGKGWSVTWVAGPDGSPDHNPGLAAENGLVGLGMAALPPGVHLEPPRHGGPRLCVVLQGIGTARPGAQAVGLGPLDALYAPAPGAEDIVNAANTPLHVLWVDEAAGE